MNQLFYNITAGIVHQIRREKRITLPEVIARGKRNIKQNTLSSAEAPYGKFLNNGGRAWNDGVRETAGASAK